MINKCYDTVDKKSKEMNKIYQDIKLVHNTDKKTLVRNIGCQKCQSIDWRF